MAILRRYLKDPKTPRPFAHNLAWTMISLARRWVRLDPVSIGEFDELRKCLGDQPKRLTEKNRRLLNTLDDPAMRAKLLVLPDRLANWAERAPPARGAITMQIAVAIAILQNAPLRIKRTLPRYVSTGIWCGPVGQDPCGWLIYLPRR